ncbi:D-isomer specific 2-hydroxyacid dehydrogenase [Legionella birminghamensis]|uniref:D-3-phosphoglycerate dehydrogenase n=1 Tax=Legionella birminghamensis TaxID=28083 RepID=A0A378I6P6_9GAMM|nr:3-phosphoglycerate dehydrogenase family protein [Legionella birminghamensis]KTC71515.1 D-isomer specific 2-hydroxyacid dehydrogenase [Legionella birminghamensis]STX30877.1 D-isomer specific 2-hydroxyacid dehydrogenase [Legionella birminghamensis]
MYSIQVIDNISPKGLELFDKSVYEVGKDFNNPDAMLVRSSKLHDYKFSDHLKAVGRAGIGTDNIPVEQLTKQGIPVFFAPGANSNAVKELVLAALLISYRNLEQSHSFLSSLSHNNQTDMHHEIETRKKQFVGREIHGKTLGVVGLGNIGVKVANAALALGMQVNAYDPFISVSNALALMPGVHIVKSLPELLSNADIVTLHVPLMSNTTNLINDSNIHLLKKSAMLMNFSREKVVSEQAILKQLNDDLLMSYVTDFPTVNLAHHARVLCFPHLGASTVEAEENSASMVVHSVKNYLEHGIIENAVNFPPTVMPLLDRSEIKRILIINRNTKGIIAEVTNILSNDGYNIEQMVNTSLDKIAVNLIDISCQNVLDSDLDRRIKAINDVIKVRVI